MSSTRRSNSVALGPTIWIQNLEGSTNAETYTWNGVSGDSEKCFHVPVLLDLLWEAS